MKLKHIVSSLLAALALAVAPAAHAAFITFQPASGYVFNGDHSAAGVRRVDGAVYFTTSLTWITPVQLEAYNIWYGGSQASTGNWGGSVNTRLVSFDKEGFYYHAGAMTTGTILNQVHTVTNGTIFVQSDIVASSCPPEQPFCANANLRSLKLTY